MFNSLRGRLILSYLAVILLTLCVAGAGVLVLLADFQRGIVNTRLSDALGPSMDLAREGVQRGDPPAQIVADIQKQVDASWRVLLLDDTGNILADSQAELTGRRLPRVALLQNLGQLRFATGRQLVAGRDLVFAAAPIATRAQGREFLLIATGVRPFTTGIEELLRPLLAAGAIALIVAVIIALVLARSISQPLGELTRASEAMARGNYEQQLPVRRDDEFGRLAGSFNLMAAAVRHSQQSQKEFVANVSHELKTPLTSIQGFAQAIAEGATRDLESARHAARLIFEESQRMARLVGDLLTLARLDTGDVPMEKVTLDLNTMVPAWVDRFRGRAQSAGVALNVSLDSPPPVVGDPVRLEQVVSNLVDNAIKYNHSGGRVDVKVGQADGEEAPKDPEKRAKGEAPKQWALVRVTDTGQGIPKTGQARVFDRFYRADRARAAGGSGLGLAIVREIVREHGGHIEFESIEGVGTTFSVLLPAKV